MSTGRNGNLSFPIPVVQDHRAASPSDALEAHISRTSAEAEE